MERHFSPFEELTRSHARPRIAGILNITADSFSDGGQFIDPHKALMRALEMSGDGADFIDIGPASSNPDSKRVSAELQIERLKLIIPALRDRGIAVSVDAYDTFVQNFALDQNVEMVNDIQGFSDPSLYPRLAESNAKLVVMHSVQRNGPATRIPVPPEQILAEIYDFFSERLQVLREAGIQDDRLIIDPGMGFFLGSEARASYTVLRNIKKIKNMFGLPVMISVSRKSFLGVVSGRNVSERGAGTLAAELYAASAGVDYIRTHDTRALCDALAVLGAIHCDEKP